jgi:subtilisin
MRGCPAVIGLLLVSGLAITPATAQQLISPGGAAGPPSRGPEIIPDRYIVELHPGASADAVARGHGVASVARFGIIHGFLAHMSHASANALSRDPRVRRVSPDLVVRAYAKPPSPPGKSKGGSGGGGTTACPTPLAPTAEQIPTGVSRIGAPTAWGNTHTGNGVKVAVIDTGIDFCHPDLAANYLEGINYIDSSQPPKDDNGHGTHVSGIIAAQQNDTGVVGVAPNAKLLAAKVLDASGSGSLSNVITALDWAVQKGARVANLSLGAVDFWCAYFGLCGAGPECTAISNAVASGVVVVVAAGNAADEALYYTPANCQDSLTVSAFADSDGNSGGLGAPMRGGVELDDSFAQSFSNHSVYYWDMDGNGTFGIADHPVVDIMAPGVEILSTMPTYDVTLTTSYGILKNYGVLSGTSMATPHVAGAAALYIGANSGATADAVRRALVTKGECPGGGDTGGLPVCESGWLDDPDGVWEPLLRASGL